MASKPPIAILQALFLSKKAVFTLWNCSGLRLCEQVFTIIRKIHGVKERRQIMPPIDLSHGFTYLQNGDFAGAETFFSNIVERNPSNPDALNGLAIAKMHTANPADSLPIFRKALAANGQNASVLNNYGVALMRSNLWHAARDVFVRAINLRPEHPDAWANLGNVNMLLQEDPHKVEAPLNRALRQNPNHADALERLASLRLAQGRHRDRAGILQNLARIQPQRAPLFLVEAARSLVAESDHDSALPLLKEAARLAPADPVVQKLYGECLGEAGYWEDARRQLRHAGEMEGGRPVWKYKHLWYCPSVFNDADAIETYWRVLEEDLDSALGEKPEFDWNELPYDGFTSPYGLPHLNRSCREVREKFARLVESAFVFEAAPERADGPLRIGFLVTPGQESGFMRSTLPLAAELDPQKYQVIVIYHHSAHGNFVRPGLAHLGMFAYGDNFAEAVEKIRELGCDLIHYWKAGEDLWSTYFPMCRLAGVQTTGWGTHGTSGISRIDHYLSWDAAEPEDAQREYTENLVRLPVAPGHEQAAITATGITRGSLGLPSGVLYMCPHRLPKYHPDFDKALDHILSGVPEAFVMILLGGQSMQGELLRKRLSDHMIPANFNRLIFLSPMNTERYLRHMSVSDVVLDAPYYSGEFTGQDAISLGVPVVGMEGGLLVQRYNAARYRMMGLEELVAGDMESYIKNAIRLGKDEGYREEISGRIIERRDELRDEGGLVEAFGKFLDETLD